MADDLYFRGLMMELEIENEQKYYYECHYKSIQKEYLGGRLKWYTKEGKGILIQEMSNNHLINSYKMMKNKEKELRDHFYWYQNLTDVLYQELNKRKLL